MAENKPMSDGVKHQSAADQTSRRLKYGANVAASLLAAAGLFVGAVYLAGETRWRMDLTRGGDFSLRPQTRNVLKQQTTPVRLVSLYERQARPQDGQDYYRRVADLLEEYRRSSGQISVELIDPKSEPSKLDNLVEQVARTESAQVEQYKSVLADFQRQLRTAVEALAAGELPKLRSLPVDDIKDPSARQTVMLAVVTVGNFASQMAEAQQRIELRMAEKIPNYRAAVADLQGTLQELSELLAGLADGLGSFGDNTNLPPQVVTYAAESAGRFREVQSQAQSLLERTKSLGELKLTALRESLRGGRSILVLGETGWRVLPFEKVFPAGQGPRQMAADKSAGGAIRRNFAGEQQISAALVSLRQANKPRVVFVRPQGPPLASPFFGQSAPFMELAARLRELNFEVMERDLSGQWAMQAQMQGLPPEEPSDEELQSAVWIVLGYQGQGGPMGGGASLAPKLKEHLDRGGSALVLSYVDGDPLTEALQPLGVTIHTDQVLVHDVPAGGPAVQSDDPIADAQRVPFIILMTDYGNHPLTRPAQSLEGLLVPMVPVSAAATPGITLTPILPFPSQTRAWAEADVQATMASGTATFDEGIDRLATPAAPLHAGVALERLTTATTAPGEVPPPPMRLVVIGNLTFATGSFLGMEDRELFRKGILAPRLPGNAQLLVGSLYWLSHQDTMLEVAPSESQVSRIGMMSESRRRLVGLGLLGLGLPLVVAVAGIAVWRVRNAD
jgi:hypothetical protein